MDEKFTAADTKMDKKFIEVGTKLDAVDEKFTAVDTKLDDMDTEVKTKLIQLTEGEFFTLQELYEEYGQSQYMGDIMVFRFLKS